MSNDAFVYGIIIAGCTIYTLGSLLLFFYARRVFWLAMAGILSVGLFFSVRMVFSAIAVRSFGRAVLFMVPVLMGSFAVFTFLRLASQRAIIRRPAPSNSIDGPNA